MGGRREVIDDGAKLWEAMNDKACHCPQILATNANHSLGLVPAWATRRISEMRLETQNLSTSLRRPTRLGASPTNIGTPRNAAEFQSNLANLSFLDVVHGQYLDSLDRIDVPCEVRDVPPDQLVSKC